MPTSVDLGSAKFRKALFRILGMGVCVIFLSAASDGLAETLRINASQVPPYHTEQGDGFEDRIAKEVYRRLGYAIEIHDVPAARGLQLLNEGFDDGTLARNPGMSRLYPELVQLEESVLERTYVAFVRDPGIRIRTWKDLATYHVGFVNGWKIMERNVENAASITKVNSGKQLFQLLVADRIDVALYNHWGGLQIIKELGLGGIRVLDPPLARRQVYFYLNKKHAALAAAASQALREIKSDGTYDRLFQEVLEPLRK